MMIQEFQHSVELQLIKVMTLQMLVVRFESITNEIQMKSTQYLSGLAKITHPML
jgi:hypothetical protein